MNHNQPLKIAIVSDAIYPYNKGGKEKRIFELTTRLAQKDHKVTIYCMKWWKGSNVRYENGVRLKAISPYIPLYSGRRRSIRQALLFGLFTLLLLKEKFDLIDADHMPHLVLFPLKLVSIMKQKPLIVTWNEVWGKTYWKEYLGTLGTVAYWIEKASTYMPDRIISISELTSKKLQTDFKVNKPLVTIPVGVSLEEIDSVKPSKDTTDIIFAGRLLKHKNVDVLLEAIKILKEKNHNIRCTIIGNGPEKRHLESLAKKLQITRNVQFVDFLDKHEELYARMKSSRVLAFPSTREGFGMIALEANACGIPVVTINHPENATQMLIKDGENGYLSSSKPDEFAKKINNALQKINDHTNVKQYAHYYNWNKIVDTLYKEYIK